jgi:hypothetical protein
MRERCSPCRSRLSVGIFARAAETQVVRWHREISIVTELDAHWMLRCEHLARQAARAGNTPVGALVVLDGKVVGEAAEEVPNGPRRFAHAELLAIEASLRATGRRSLETATLYTTASRASFAATPYARHGLPGSSWGDPRVRRAAFDPAFLSSPRIG